jgi:hypothetical protein
MTHFSENLSVDMPALAWTRLILECGIRKEHCLDENFGLDKKEARTNERKPG